MEQVRKRPGYEALILWPKGSPKVAGEGKHIYFYEEEPKPKTKIWAVYSKAANVFLGRISWYPWWRQYCFYPANDTVDAASCLRDIADFCQKQTSIKREA